MRTCEFTPDAPLGHHLDKVTGAELEGEIPSYAEHYDFPVKVPALKELLCRGGFRHRWPLTPQSQLFKFAPEPHGGILSHKKPVPEPQPPRESSDEFCKRLGIRTVNEKGGSGVQS